MSSHKASNKDGLKDKKKRQGRRGNKVKRVAGNRFGEQNQSKKEAGKNKFQESPEKGTIIEERGNPPERVDWGVVTRQDLESEESFNGKISSKHQGEFCSDKKAHVLANVWLNARSKERNGKRDKKSDGWGGSGHKGSRTGGDGRATETQLGAGSTC